VLRPLLQQGLPLAIAMTSHAFINLVDLWIVGWLGAEAVAGVHVATTVNFLPMIFGNAVSVASMSMMARYSGAGQLDAARAVSWRAHVLMLWLGIGLGIAGAATAGPCVDLQGATGAAREIGVHYLVVSSLGTVTMFLLMQCTATMRASSDAWLPFALLLAANLLNLGLDVLLVFGWDLLAVPALGAPGAAYASVLARAAAVVVGLFCLRRRAHPLRLCRPRGALPTAGQAFAGLLRLGLPQALQMLVRAGVVILLTAAAADLAGQPVLAALGVTTRLDTLVFFSAAGFASAATTLVGHKVGAGQMRSARLAALAAAGIAGLFAAAVAALFAIFAESIVAVFVTDPGAAVVTAATEYLWIGVLTLPLAACCVAGTGAVNGAGASVGPMVLDLCGYLGVLLPAVVVAVTAGHVTSLRGLWTLSLAVHGALALAYVVYLTRARWLLRAVRRRATLAPQP
jgi:putative MATE family efflux protein